MTIKKPATKKSMSKKSDSSDKEATPMPRLIFTEGVLPAEKAVAQKIVTQPLAEDALHQKAEEQLFHITRRATYNSTNRTWMWIGVSTISIIIVFLWGWSLKSQILSVSWNKSPENQLIERTKANWQEAFAATPNDGLQFQEVKNQLVTALQQMAASSSPSVGASTSPNAISSTTKK